LLESGGSGVLGVVCSIRSPRGLPGRVVRHVSSQSTRLSGDSGKKKCRGPIFGDPLTLTPESQEWFMWLASIPSFAGRAGRFTARREAKQRRKTCDLTAEKLEATSRSMSGRPAGPICIDGDHSKEIG